jgi:proline racemase
MTSLLENLKKWNPADRWHPIQTIEAHAGGEPLRIVVGGYPELPGKTLLERRRHAKSNLDSVRTMLMWEPRGHADMYGCVILPATSAQADFSVLFLHNEGYSSMCGHGIIAVTTVVLELGGLPIVEPVTTVRIDTPAGLVTSHARVSSGRVTSVYFHNVPSYVAALDETVTVPTLGKIRYDLAFGGAYYAYVNAEEAGVACTKDRYAELIEKGMLIKRAVMESRPFVHPFQSDLGFLYGTIFIGPPLASGSDSRNVCIFAEGEVDRSPTGTGVSGRMAIHHARREVGIGEPIVIESIIGTTFIGRVVEETTFGPYRAVIPEVEGSAYVTGGSLFVADPRDLLGSGFLLR